MRDFLKKQVPMSVILAAAVMMGICTTICGIPSDCPWESDGSDMWSTVPGNVGIGTSSPTTKLDVSGRVTATDFRSNSYTVSGTYIKIYDARDENPEEIRYTNPVITFVATALDRVGNVYFHLLGAYHCNYCYSGGPKAVIYTTGNVPFTFYTSGSSVYVASDRNHTFCIHSTNAINPTAVGEIPGGAARVEKVN